MAVESTAPPSTATASSPSNPAKPGGKPGHGESNVKDRIESILVAFILAFIFRTFVVEAFVIPTGSMAPTLLGAHMRFRCADCAYFFTVNYSGRSSGDDVEIPGFAEAPRGAGPRVFRVNCPNCGLQVPPLMKNDPENDALTPPVFYGDRILVLKYIWLLDDPDR